MKQFYFYFIVVILIFFISCSKEIKTKPIVVEEEQPQIEQVEEKGIEENKTKSVEDITGVVTIEVNKTMEYISEEEEQEIIKEQEPKKTIIIQDLQFKPEKIRIPKGTTVIWKHQDKYNNQNNIYHIIVVYPSGKKSQKMSYGDRFNITFDDIGSYYFIDAVYKEQMRGDIIVE